MKQVISSFMHNPSVVKTIAGLDALVVRLSCRLGKKAHAQAHVVLTTTGHGNIGDQAMFEAYLHNVHGNVVAVMPEQGAFQVPKHDRARVSTVSLDSLIYGRGVAHYRDLWRFGQILATARSYSVTGADIMDGGYNSRLSEMEWTTAIAAQQCGVPTQILGFSWNSTPARAALALARRAGEVGVRMLVRDPLSFHRMSRSEVRGVVQAADTVFLLGDMDTELEFMHLAQSWVAEGRRIALVNCSGLIDTSRDLVADYVRVVSFLIDSGFRVVLVPHVIRPDSNDLDVCRRVHDEVGASEVILLESLLEPRQVKALASLADVIVTGRMHLSVLGLSVATPSVVLATQGKVEGLMALFGRPEWNIEPREGFSDHVIGALAPIVSTSVKGWSEGIRGSLESVSGLSTENFVMLQEPSKVSI